MINRSWLDIITNYRAPRLYSYGCTVGWSAFQTNTNLSTASPSATNVLQLIDGFPNDSYLLILRIRLLGKLGCTAMEPYKMGPQIWTSQPLASCWEPMPWVSDPSMLSSAVIFGQVASSSHHPTATVAPNPKTWSQLWGTRVAARATQLRSS